MTARHFVNGQLAFFYSASDEVLKPWDAKADVSQAQAIDLMQAHQDLVRTLLEEDVLLA